MDGFDPMTIYVGNLPYSIGETEIRQAFEEFGEVQRVRLIHDRESGQSKGFAFVEMPDREGLHAISQLDFANWEGRKLNVNVAKPRTPGGAQPA
jgi:RNA recognition motif-containing protein